jgi:hypothetical protein
MCNHYQSDYLSPWITPYPRTRTQSDWLTSCILVCSSTMGPRVLSRLIHWRNPTVLLSAFIAGLTFAIGHHAFYSHLDSQPVDRHLFDQQTNLAIGQALAFLVRASFVISIGASYWQVFWGTVLNGPFAVPQLDTLAGMLRSLLDLLDLKAFTTRPILFAMALLS